LVLLHHRLQFIQLTITFCSEGGFFKIEDVRYVHYPSLWFIALFPGGWEAIAQREGFELPKNFRNNGPDK